jgi:hypothetical protein
VCLANNEACAAVTDGALCPFDVGSNVCDGAGEDAFTSQFRLAFTPETSSSGAYQLGSGAPGETYYNAIVQGTPGSSVAVSFTVPYPYVTVGAQPLQVYDALALGTEAATGCFQPNPTPLASGGPAIVLRDYLALCDTGLGLCRNGVGACAVNADCVVPNSSGVTCVAPTGSACDPTTGPDLGGQCTFTTSVQLPASGQAYVNLHLDYGLEGARVDLCADGVLDRYNWGVNASVGGIDALENTLPSTAMGDVVIANCTDYTFQHTAGAGPSLSATVENLNQFSACTDAADVDCDGIPNAQDLCPYYAGNTLAGDVDGDDRGDACECGDQNGDGKVNISDLVAINFAIFNPTSATPLCDANNDNLCNVSDILAANLEIFSPNSSTCARHPVPGP